MFNVKSARFRKNLKKFSKKRVDVGMYVKDLYVDNGLAYISCNVKNYNDIIDPKSVEGYEWLTEDFDRFIDSNANYIPTEYPIVLEICGCKFNKKQRECIEATIADYYALKMGDTQMALSKNLWKSVVLALFDIIFALIRWLPFINFSNETISEATLVLFWFFLWEFTNCMGFERRDLKQQRTEAAQLASIKVTFQEKFEDGPVEPEEEQQILEEVFEDDVIVPSDEWT